MVLAMGAMGLVVGAIVTPVVGALVGWPVGIFAAEWLGTRHVNSAKSSAVIRCVRCFRLGFR